MRHGTLLCIGIVSYALSASAAADLDAIFEGVRSATLDDSRAVSVQNLVVDVAFGELELTDGALVPAEPIDGRPRELAFVGSGRLRITPPDAIERQQLELFTEQPELDVGISQAVFVVGDAAIVEALLGRSQDGVDATAVAAADALFEGWVSGAERRGIGAGAAVFKSVLGDPAYQHYFAAFLESDDVGNFYYIADPSELEQVLIGQFVPFELDDVDQHRINKQIRKEQRRGRAMQVRLGDLGQFNTWLQASLRDGSGELQPGVSGFEPTHYTINATIDPGDQLITGRVTIELEAQVDGRRALDLQLFSDLKPTAVRDAAGNDVPWWRSGFDLFAVLPEAVPAGERFELVVEYSGVILEKRDRGIFVNRSTGHWYPRAGAIDRAKYALTLRYPKKYDLLASGKLIDSTVEAGMAVERRELDRESLAVSFEIGAFQIVEEQVGHVALRVGFAKSPMPKSTGAKEEVLATLRDALVFYEETFGPYPLDYLTVVTVERGFSQGFLGFLTLTHYLMLQQRLVYQNDLAAEVRVETVAHELAHQWWGNQVGWFNYRDQWLSEALADYAAVLYTLDKRGSKAMYLARHAQRWKRAINAPASDGRSVESLGPVVLGARLNSSFSSRAYQAVVYDKGSVVFTMLARMLGPKPFNQMLKDLVQAVANRVISTETFLNALERMSGSDLSSFAEQYIYGTGVPEVYYTYDFRPGDAGKWVIRGAARQVARADYSYRLVETASGTWDVLRERMPTEDLSEWLLVVPFQIQVDPGAARTSAGLGGQMVIKGEDSAYEFPIPRKPVDFWLDQRGEVLAWFYCENRQPKRMLRFRAMEATPGDAEPLFQQALTTALLSEKERGVLDLSQKDVDRLTRQEDSRILLDLTRLYLDLGREDEARAAFRRSDELASGNQKKSATRRFLAGRLALRDGDFKEAYGRLTGSLRLPFPRRATDTAGDDLRRKRWASGRTGDGEDYALLAVAAFETGHKVVARRALEEAEERGAERTGVRRYMPRSSR